MAVILLKKVKGFKEICLCQLKIFIAHQWIYQAFLQMILMKMMMLNLF